ncbi:MAG: hypothetical protein ACLQU2_12690 [Candidatus Binataceae bacterium]
MGKPDLRQYHDISKDAEMPEDNDGPEDNDRSEEDNTRMSLAEECDLWRTRGAYLPLTQPEYEQATAKCSKLSTDQLRTQLIKNRGLTSSCRHWSLSSPSFDL